MPLKDLHPDARVRIDSLAIEVLTSLECLLRPPDDGSANEPASRSPDERFIAFTLTDKDVRAPFEETETDKDGNQISRAAYYPGGALVLRDEGFKKYRALASTARRTATFRDSVSEKAVLDWIWKWLKGVETARESSLSQFLLAQATEAVAPRQFVIPVHQVLCPVAFRLGNVGFRTVREGWLADMDEFERTHSGGRMSDVLAANHRKRRQQMQGYLSCFVEVDAEPQFGREYSVREAENSVAILRLASLGIARALGRSFCTLLGGEALQTRTLFQVIDKRLRADSGYLVSESPAFWQIDGSHLKQAVLPLLQPWDLLLRRQNARTEFQEAALKAALMLSRATVQDGLGDKLLFCFVALESVLLKDEKEPITSTIADRMAFIAEEAATARMEKAKLVRDVYDYRSRYVHHASELQLTAKELERIDKFLIHALLSLRQIAVISLKGGTREELLQALDAKKYA